MVDQRTPQQIASDRRVKWRDFMDFVERHQQSNWIFRGVADARNHYLIPKIGRGDFVYDEATERVIFANFRRRARQFVDTTGMDYWDLIALAQHHGLPTRLLDWSTNPLVAAYFAVTSSPSNTVARVYAAQAPQLVDTSTQTNPFLCNEISAFVPSAIAPRIVAQRGLFTIHPNPTLAWERRGSAGTVSRDDHHFDIAQTHRSFFERKLFQVGVDPAAIMCDLDGICDTLAWQFRSGIAVGKFNY